MRTAIRHASVLAAVLVLTSASAWAQTALYLNSQAGDYVGGGQTVTYDPSDGVFTADRADTAVVDISFHTPGYEHFWSLRFAAPEGQTLTPGMYEGTTRYPFQSPVRGGLDVDGDGRGCNRLSGRFSVLEAIFDEGGHVLNFAADFEQHCEGDAAALYGSIRFNSSVAIAPRVSIGDAAAIEGPFGGSVTFTISLSEPASVPVTVQFATADGTARAGSDYVERTGTVTLDPPQTSRQVTITILNDGAAQGEQQFHVLLSNPSGASVAFGRAKGTILDGEGPHSLLILDSGPGDYIGQGLQQTLTVLDGVFTAPPTYPGSRAVDVHFESDTWWDVHLAAPSNDVLEPGVYEGAARWPFQLVNQPGLDVSGDGRGCNTLTGRFEVLEARYRPNGDVLSLAADFEQHCEGLAPALHGAIRFNSAVPVGAGGQFEFSAPTYTVNEAAAFATITVNRVNGSGLLRSRVDYSTDDGGATSVGLNQDYTPRSGTLTFASNHTATFRVPITRDTFHEGNESLVLRLSNPQPAFEGASLGAQNTAVLTIVDNDRGGTIQFAPSARTISVAPSGGSITLAVQRTGGIASGASVHCTMADGTAVGGVNYDNTPREIAFTSSGPGATLQVLSIPFSVNPSEAKTFSVTLSGPMGGAVLGAATTAQVTILGTQPTLSFSSGAYNVRTTQATALVTVRRSAPLTGTATVHYATSPGSALNGGVDYTDVSGTLSFAPNVSTRAFSVPITKDAFVDVDKTVNLTLSDPSWTGGTAAVDSMLGTSVLTIQNPNQTPSVQFSLGTYTTNEQTPRAVIVVRRTGDLAGTVSVDYAANGGTATNGDPSVSPGADYTLNAGTLTFGPGIASGSFTIPIVNDAQAEGTETAVLSLANPTWTGGTAIVGSIGTAVLQIIDNEPTLQFAGAAYTVGEAANALTITVKRTGAATAQATVGYAVTGGSAVPDTGAGGDYVALAPATLTFLPGQTARSITIRLLPDTAVDGPKTIELALNSPTNASLGTPSATVVTIRDDDVAGKVGFSAAVYSVAENGGMATIAVSRTGGRAGAVTVNYASMDTDPGTTAVVGADYTSISGTLTFAPNETTQTFTVPVLDNGVPDGGAVAIVLALDTPAGGLALGAPVVATLWVVRE
jgi:hypothetical protein